MTETGFIDYCGLRFPNDPEVITPPIRLAMENGFFEDSEITDIDTLCVLGDRVLDLGAGTGLVSAILWGTGLPDAILAVEPDPRMCDYMRRLFDANHITGIDIIEAAVSENEEETIYIREDFWMNGNFSDPNPWSRTILAPGKTLSSLIESFRPTIILCDVEGAETWIFERADLSGVRFIRIEFHDHVTGLARISDTIAALSRSGFAYDPRYSRGSVVHFSNVEIVEQNGLRPYPGKMSS